jgi:uncharacterized membrane protein YccF (DUF307 family)
MGELTRPAEHAPPSDLIVVDGRKPGFLIRTVWFVFIGWWLTGIALAVGYLAGLTVVGLPLAFWTFNRTGTFLTLRPRSQSYTVDRSSGAMVVSASHAQQRALWLRALYFVAIGWWAALLWMTASYLISLTIVGIPIGIMMLNRLPEVFTLHRN